MFTQTVESSLERTTLIICRRIVRPVDIDVTTLGSFEDDAPGKEWRGTNLLTVLNRNPTMRLFCRGRALHGDNPKLACGWELLQWLPPTPVTSSSPPRGPSNRSLESLGQVPGASDWKTHLRSLLDMDFIALSAKKRPLWRGFLFGAVAVPKRLRFGDEAFA
jgi:hypothetical protein